MCALIGVKNLKTTAYHPQTYSKTRDSKRPFSCAFDITLPNMKRTGTSLCHHFRIRATRKSSDRRAKFRLALSWVDTHQDRSSSKPRTQYRSTPMAKNTASPLHTSKSSHLNFASISRCPCEKVGTGLQTWLWQPCTQNFHLRTRWIYFHRSTTTSCHQISRCTSAHHRRIWKALAGIALQRIILLHNMYLNGSVEYNVAKTSVPPVNHTSNAKKPVQIQAYFDTRTGSHSITSNCSLRAWLHYFICAA